MVRVPDLLLAILVGALLPHVCSGQASAIIVSQVVPDGTWIARQCEVIERTTSADEAVRVGLDRARKACGVYHRSIGEGEPPDASRDTWVRAMLAIQDDVGRGAMRLFIPEIGSMLPSDLGAYSLFLFPDDRWQEPEFDRQRENLKEVFQSFGRSLGDNRAAIWFLDQERKIDVLRSKEYCDRFLLNYNDGPYLVTTRKRPDLVQKGDEIVVVRLGGIAPDRVLTVLNRLSQDLRRPPDRSTEKPPDVSTGMLLYEELKQRFLTTVERYPEGVRAFVSTVFAAP